MNGSDANGGCQQECVGEASGIRRCDCIGTAREGNITGVLIDGMIPTYIDISQRGNWASQLFTIQASMTSYALGFRFQSHVVLQEVELYVLYCPAWQIGATTINVYDSTTYPSFTRGSPSIGSVTLTSNTQNCESITRVSIPLQRTVTVSSYFIEFIDLIPLVHWLHIAEVRFSDQPISTVTTDDPTDPITEPSSGSSRTENATIFQPTSTTSTSDIMSITNTQSSSSTTSTTNTQPSSSTTSITNIQLSSSTTNTQPSFSTTSITYTQPSSSTSITNTQPSSSTTSIISTQSSSSTTIIGVLVGVVGVLLMFLLITWGVVIISYFIINKNQTRVQPVSNGIVT